MTLNELPRGRRATITSFGEAVTDTSRFISMGLMPGAPIAVLRVAPLGCPLQVKVGSTLLSIRRSEASGICVEAVA